MLVITLPVISMDTVLLVIALPVLLWLVLSRSGQTVLGMIILGGLTLIVGKALLLAALYNHALGSEGFKLLVACGLLVVVLIAVAARQRWVKNRRNKEFQP
jgi:hypothetical protein